MEFLFLATVIVSMEHTQKYALTKTTLYEKWLYALKNLYKLTQRPKELCEKVFDRLFEEAEIANYLQQEIDKLLTSRKYSIGCFIANPWRMIKKWFKG